MALPPIRRPVALHFKVLVHVSGAAPAQYVQALVAVNVWQYVNPACPIDPFTSEPLTVCTTAVPVQ